MCDNLPIHMRQITSTFSLLEQYFKELSQCTTIAQTSGWAAANIFVAAIVVAVEIV